nr:GTPase [uncultured Enterobacter sp.]
MFSDWVIINKLYQDARPLLAKCVAAERLNQIDTELATREASSKPVVMVYGVYNAGKSTFINALVGKVVAEMDDVPRTDRVTAYQFAQFDVIDTPGIDAPVEHERVSRDQLQRSDSVIFLLSSDGVFDEQATYTEIFRILSEKKPLLIVINNKSGYSESDREYTAIVDKIKQNLLKLAPENLKEQALQLPVWLVNAKSALKAKLEQKPALLAKSNILTLEREVKQLFMLTDKAAMLNTVKGLVRSEIDHALFTLSDLAPEGEQKSLMKLRDRVDDARQALQAKTERKIYAEKGKLRDTVYQLLNAQQYDSVQTELESWQNEVVEYFQTQLSVTMIEIGKQAEHLISDIPRFSGSGVGGNSSLGAEGQSLFSLNDLVHFGRQIKLDNEILKDGMIGAMKMGKDFFPKLFKGIGPKTMEKFAGRIVPFVGPAIDVVMGIYEFYQAKAAEEKEVERQRLYYQRLTEQSTRLVTDVQDACIEMFDDIIRQIFNPIINELQDELDRLENHTAGNERLVNRLSSIRESLA